MTIASTDWLVNCCSSTEEVLANRSAAAQTLLSRIMLDCRNPVEYMQITGSNVCFSSTYSYSMAQKLDHYPLWAVSLYSCRNFAKGWPIFTCTTLRHSAGYDMARCQFVTSRCSIETAGLIQLIFGTKFPRLSHTTVCYKGDWVGLSQA